MWTTIWIEWIPSPAFSPVAAVDWWAGGDGYVLDLQGTFGLAYITRVRKERDLDSRHCVCGCTGDVLHCMRLCHISPACILTFSFPLSVMLLQLSRDHHWSRWNGFSWWGRLKKHHVLFARATWVSEPPPRFNRHIGKQIERERTEERNQWWGGHSRRRSNSSWQTNSLQPSAISWPTDPCTCSPQDGKKGGKGMTTFTPLFQLLIFYFTFFFLASLQQDRPVHN